MPTTLTEYLSRLNGPEGQNSSTRDEIVTALLADFPDFGDRSGLHQAGGPRDHHHEARERIRRCRPVCWVCVRQVAYFTINGDGIPVCIDCQVRGGPVPPPSTPTGISYLDHARILRNGGEVERAEIFEHLALTHTPQGSY